MSTPTLAQARSYQARQKAIAAAAVVAVRSLLTARERPSVETIAATASRYQWGAAEVAVRGIAGFANSGTPKTTTTAFVGVSSLGFPLTEPIIATIDARVPAPPEALPASWWEDSSKFLADIEQLILSEVMDAARTASQVEFVSRPDWTNYVRVLTPPSCKRCVPLAGRIYRDLESFERHPGDDCLMVPVDDWESAHDAGYVFSPQEAYDKGYIKDLTEAETKAIEDGADINQVINSSSGITTVAEFGHRVKATTHGTTKRAAWRKANPTRLVRLRPESIYKFAKDRDDAIRLLKLYGYLTS